LAIDDFCHGLLGCPRRPRQFVYNEKGVGQSEWAKAHFFVGPMRSDVAARISTIAGRVGLSEGIEIVEVELLGGGSKRLVRVYIDKPGGVTHADCENISRQVGTILDVEDVMPGGGYTLEVSSPGVERKLAKPGDFEKFEGEKVKIVLREAVEGQKYWEGTLASFRDGDITLEPKPGKQIRFPLAMVARANLKFEW